MKVFVQGTNAQRFDEISHHFRVVKEILHANYDDVYVFEDFNLKKCNA